MCVARSFSHGTERPPERGCMSGAAGTAGFMAAHAAISEPLPLMAVTIRTQRGYDDG